MVVRVVRVVHLLVKPVYNCVSRSRHSTSEANRHFCSLRAHPRYFAYSVLGLGFSVS